MSVSMEDARKEEKARISDCAVWCMGLSLQRTVHMGLPAASEPRTALLRQQRGGESKCYLFRVLRLAMSNHCTLSLA